MLNPRILSLVGMVFAGAAMRLVPHPPNFTPIAAMALFAGAQFGDKRLAIVVPLAAMFVSDLILSGGWHAMMPCVYLSFALVVCLGRMVGTRRSPWVLGSASFVGSIAFFIVTNFGVWLVFSMYPKTAAGLSACYIAAIPFFRNTLLGDLFFTAMLFGLFEFAQRAWPVLKKTELALEKQ